MIGIPAGLVVANAIEWGFHKYVLHGLGRSRRSFYAYHFHDHHRAARRNGMHDPAYEQAAWHEGQRAREILSLATGVAAVLPLAPVAPFFAATLIWSAWNYHRVHRRSHRDPRWAREHAPWHYAHHMGRNQDANWCITRPWFDLWLGTAEPMPGVWEPPARARRAPREARSADAEPTPAA